MFRGIPGSQQQEDAERGVQAHHHFHRGVMPVHQDQVIDGSRKQQSHQYLHDFQHSFAAHVRPPHLLQVRTASIKQQGQRNIEKCLRTNPVDMHEGFPIRARGVYAGGGFFPVLNRFTMNGKPAWLLLRTMEAS